MKLYFRFFFTVTLILTFTVAIISGIFIKSENQIIINVSNDRLKSNITDVESNLDTFLDTYFSLAETLAKDDQIEEFMSTYDLSNQENLDYIYNKLDETYQSSRYLNNVLLAYKDGYLTLDAKKIIWDAPHDHREMAYYLYFEENPTLDKFILPPKLAPMNQLPIFDIAHRVRFEDTYYGTIILPINVNLLMEEIIYDNLHDQDITVLITDKNGDIYGSQNKDYIFNDDYNLKTIEPEFFEEMITTESSLVDRTFMGVDSTVTYTFYEPMNSYIIALKDTSERELNQLKGIITGITTALLLIFISGIIILLFTKKLVSPINRLSEYAKEVSQGVYDIDIPRNNFTKFNELNTLTESFKKMVHEINRHFVAEKEAQQVLSIKNEELETSRQELIKRFDEINSQKEHIDYLANFDVLTSLPNRKHFISKLSQVLHNNSEGAILILDLDNFKSMNDTLGHLFGDYLLESIANILLEMTSDHLFVARIGGDEFAILLTAPDILTSTLDQLTETFQHSIIKDDTKVEVNFSIGVALFPDDSNHLQELLSFADIALYSAKNKGKNNAKFFNTDMEKKVHKQNDIELTIKDALANDGFTMNYQPQVDLKTGKIIAFEALLRMKSLIYGPSEFIPVAEDNGQIIEIGRWVTESVIRQIRQWLDAGYEVKPVSLNFSAYQLYDAEYLNDLKSLLEKYQVAPNMLEIEITESIYIENVAMTTIFLENLEALGVKISIDDFGTGYSSLSYLTYMPFSKLKIDRSLSVKFLNRTNGSVISSIIDLAHSLGLIVVAEGIEDAVSIEKLRQANCDIIQGYFYSKPIDVNLVPEIFNKTFE